MIVNPLSVPPTIGPGMGEMAARGRRRRGGRGAIAMVAAWLLVFALAYGAAAQDIFRGVPVTPLFGTYLVLKDVNVRGKPGTRAKRLGKLRKGDRVEAVGKAEGAWLAVAREGEGLGFVFAPMLLPLIDGALETDIEGRAPLPGGEFCDYSIRFEGKSPVEGGLFETSDYEVAYRCPGDDGDLEFSTYMFITEAPYQLSPNHVYQISIDVTDVSGGYDEILSTVFLFEARRRRVIFDSVSLREFRRSAAAGKRPASTVAEALSAAVEMAPGMWNDKVWRTLASVPE